MPKTLPCPRCKDVARDSERRPQTIGTPSHWPYVVKCRACGSAYKLTTKDWARLPELTTS